MLPPLKVFLWSPNPRCFPFGLSIILLIYSFTTLTIWNCLCSFMIFFDVCLFSLKYKLAKSRVLVCLFTAVFPLPRTVSGVRWALNGYWLLVNDGHWCYWSGALQAQGPTQGQAPLNMRGGGHGSSLETGAPASIQLCAHQPHLGTVPSVLLCQWMAPWSPPLPKPKDQVWLLILSTSTFATSNQSPSPKNQYKKDNPTENRSKVVNRSITAMGRVALNSISSTLF